MRAGVASGLYLTGWLVAYLHIRLWLTVLTCSNTSLNSGGGGLQAGFESYRSVLREKHTILPGHPVLIRQEVIRILYSR